MVVAAKQFGVDFSGLVLSAAKLKADGGHFMLRYSAGVGNTHSNTQWKLCKLGEIAAAAKIGIDFIANSEWYESRITEGSAAGRADGLADLAFWKSRGLRRGALIYVSWDAAPVSSKWAAADAYLRAYKAALAGYYGLGCYAGTPYLKHLISAGITSYGWRPNAGSWSNDGLPYQPSKSSILGSLWSKALSVTPARIWQTGNYWYSKGADECVILRAPVGSHLQTAVPAPVPSPPPASPYYPYLRRRWPSYIPRVGHYFGPITGPWNCHGGATSAERADVKAIQVRLQQLGFAPKTSGWADGIWGSPTSTAVVNWQKRKGYTVNGHIGPVNWARLFTY